MDEEVINQTNKIFIQYNETKPEEESKTSGKDENYFFKRSSDEIFYLITFPNRIDELNGGFIGTNENKIKIIGANTRTMDCLNREVIEN